MESVVYMTHDELREAVKAYLVAKLMMPEHGVVECVTREKKFDACAEVDVKVPGENGG